MSIEVKLGDWADQSEAQEAAVSTWLKKPGQAVRQGEVLAEATVEKVNLEVEAPADGILLEIVAPVGQVIRPDSVLARLGTQAEWEALSRPATPVPVATATAVAGGAGGGGGELVASPVAKRLLREHNLNLAEVAAFLGKREGRIGEEEVQRYLAEQAAPAAPSNGQEGDSLLLYSGLRQVIGERMSRSLREMAQLTLSSEADVTELVAQRESLRAQGQSLSYTALIARVVALTLPRYPSLNARLEEANIRLCRDLNLGIAVDLPEGLLVPVIRNAGALSAAELTARIEQLSQQTRQGQLGVEDSAGGTFTISNLGAFEVDVFTPIINPPQAAILGVGRIADRAGVVGGQLAPRKMLWLSLSFDHRLLDGGPAAAFLKEVRQRLEQPEELFK